MNKKKNKIYRIAVFGAAPDTPNMGVSALYISALNALSENFDQLEFVVFDNKLGLRNDHIEINKKLVKVTYFGARGGVKYYRSENLLTMLFMSKFGRIGSILNQGIKLIDSCDAIVDISGGDSFSDIYGIKRFNTIIRPKFIAINRKVPLILLPQTYGPYKNIEVYNKAREAVQNADMAWARDKYSFDILKDMLGENFNKKHHCSGVDMAFSLLAKDASSMIDEKLNQYILSDEEPPPLIGINVSGLIYNNPIQAEKVYGLRADYSKVIHEFISYIIKNTNAIIVLISHVMDKPGHYESDLQACLDVYNNVDEKYKNRVFVSPLELDQSETKWLISKMDWFCGTRMHSTIAALSSFVPTCSIAYSDKTKGVFESCGQAKYVFDPRSESTREVLDKMIKAYDERELSKKSLIEGCSATLLRSKDQFKKIADYIAAK